MKLPRRQFLHLAAGAAALPAMSMLLLASLANTWLGCSDSSSSLRMCLGPAVRLARPVQLSSRASG
jgi:hypothetical protein